MSYKKLSISITISILLGTIASAQSQSQQAEFTPNSVIAYFSEDGTLLPDRNDSAYYRYFNDIVSGCYLVQDFYTINDQKQTDPICFTDPSELQSWFPQSMQGPLTFWSIDGQKIQEGYSQQDGGSSGFWKSWDEYGNANSYELINGELVLSYFDQEGNRQSTPVAGGTFRTLLDQDPSTNEYIISDYFTDTRTRQMDPVIINQDDLLRWDIQFRRGTYVYYDIEGNILTLEDYNDMGRLDGAITNWYSDIHPPQKFEEINFNDGTQEGLYVRWYPNGYPKIKLNIAENEIDFIECWNENFESLPEDQCTLLLDESFDPSVLDADAPIQIIIPEDEIETSAPSQLNNDEIPSVEVITPNDELTDEVNLNYYEQLEEAEIIEEQYDQSPSEIIDNDDINNEVDLNYAEQLEVVEEIEAEYDEPAQTEGQKILRSIKGILNAL